MGRRFRRRSPDSKSSLPLNRNHAMQHAAFGGIAQSGRLAVWSVLRHRRRTAVAMAAVAFGVAALILAGAFIEWIFWATRQGAIQSGLGHVQVARRGFHEKGTADLDRY